MYKKKKLCVLWVILLPTGKLWIVWEFKVSSVAWICSVLDMLWKENCNILLYKILNFFSLFIFSGDANGRSGK